MTIEPVRKNLWVPARPEIAFETFTAGIGSWWPLVTHSIGQEDTVTCFCEPRAGGRLYERMRDGREGEWGRVLAWEPPHRLVWSWHPGRAADTSQEVEVRFTAERNGTRVELEHRGWERYGEGANEARNEYVTGWDFVFGERFAAACK